MTKRQALLILGGTSGLGRDLAQRGWLQGAVPVVLGRDVEKIQQDRELREVRTFEVDLTNPRLFLAEEHVSFEEMVRDLDVTHIFWVAGIPQTKPFLEMTSQEVAELMQVHLAGPVKVLHKLLQILPRKPIHLVTISTAATLNSTLKGKGLYRTLKRAKETFTNLLLDDLPGSFVSIFHLSPMATSFRQQIGTTPGQLLLNPSDVAKVMVLATGVGRGPTFRYVFPPFTEETVKPICTYVIEPDVRDPVDLILREVANRT